jgi:hypothetical protein
LSRAENRGHRDREQHGEESESARHPTLVQRTCVLVKADRAPKVLHFEASVVA